MTKHELREQVFKAVFSIDTQLETENGIVPEEIVKNYLTKSCDEPLTEDETDYIFTKASAIGDMLTQLDEEINAVAEGWKTNRMGKAELNILRLAVYEIRYDESIPVKVAINEAVELAKEYCNQDAPSFINGMLAHFA
ncbi:MAG: transcription antitermination factor NusB [Lachnospiraceae bacterium]|nr:transcription antitermination factor NusB [Lachnospiraceae bacterium]